MLKSRSNVQTLDSDIRKRGVGLARGVQPLWGLCAAPAPKAAPLTAATAVPPGDRPGRGVLAPKTVTIRPWSLKQSNPPQTSLISPTFWPFVCLPSGSLPTKPPFTRNLPCLPELAPAPLEVGPWPVFFVVTLHFLYPKGYTKSCHPPRRLVGSICPPLKLPLS